MKVNGKKPEDIKEYLHEISFDNINNDNNSTGSGKFENIVYEK